MKMITLAHTGVTFAILSFYCDQHVPCDFTSHIVGYLTLKLHDNG
jgi:hypothetical protein